MEEKELTQDELDEKACGERVDFWLKKYDCVLSGECVIRTGAQPIIRVGIMKIPAEVRKQMKAAQKHGRPVESA